MADGQRYSDTRLENTGDPLWWGLSALLSLGALAVPRFLSLQSDETTRMIMVEAALFFTGALVGCFRPKRIWRWALASLMTFLVRDIVTFLLAPALSPDEMTSMAVYLLGNSPLYFVQVVPVFVGAYLGASISSAGLD